MGAAWKNPKERDMPLLKEMIRGVKDMGLETCMTLGMLTPDQAQQLAQAGWIITTTTLIPLRNFMATSSPHAHTKIA